MLNKMLLQGRFTEMPQLKSTQTGINVVSFTIASERDRPGQDGKRETDFIRCVAWRGTAEFICRNFSKGQSAVLEGSMRSVRWMEDDKTRYGVELEVDAIYFCGPKKETGENGGEAVISFPPPGENAFSLDEPF